MSQHEIAMSSGFYLGSQIARNNPDGLSVNLLINLFDITKTFDNVYFTKENFSRLYIYSGNLALNREIPSLIVLDPFIFR